MPETETAYLNYKQLALQYEIKSHTFIVMTATRNHIIEGASVTGIYGKDGMRLRLVDYGQAGFRRRADADSVSLLVDYAAGPPELPELTLEFTLDLAGLHIRVLARGDLDWHIAGFLHWGQDMEHDTFAVCLNRDGQDLRCALGPAASTADNALYDRKQDEALEFFGSAPVRLHYDWSERAYRFEVSSGGCDFARSFSIRIISRVYEQRFGVPFRPINKRNTFPTPPAGWMTWYAVQFDAGEQTVLDNATWQAEHLRDFGATAIWVDWEWYHGNMSGRGEPDADSFHPDPCRYPNGLKPVADRIRQLGLIPALWIGFTNDPTENAFIRARPETVLVHKPAWCGQYFFDLTHPSYLEQFLPAALGQLTEWGFAALKWDCLPVTLQNLDQEHNRLYNPEFTSEQALRQAVEKARALLGPDFYMLSCSGHTTRDITMAVDLFDAARIGGDIFQWESFISQCVQRVMKYYPFHNVLFYADPDNVILRSKFNTLDQAVSRLSWVSLLGLPLTLGDNLPDLPEERVNLLRRGLPAIDAHPMDLRETVHDGRIVKLNLAIERPYESWNVVDVLNLTE